MVCPITYNALVKAKGMASGGNRVMVYFTCNDCRLEQDRVEDSGVKILKEKFSIGQYGFCSICKDTEDNTIGLHSMN